MGVSIANLVVKLSASPEGLVAGTAVGAKAVRKFSVDVSDMGVSFGSVATKALAMGTVIAGVAAAGVVSFGALAKTQFDLVDQVGNLSERMGVSTEALSVMRYAADQADVSFESLTGAMDKMILNLGKAQLGSDGASGAFAELGLDAAQLAKMTPDAAFRKIQDQLAGVDNASRRTAIGVGIFGKRYAEIDNLITPGSNAIDAAGMELESFGGIITGLDTAKVALADKELKRLSASVSAVAKTVAVELSPYVAEASHQVVEFVRAGNGFRDDVLPAIRSTAEFVGYVADGFNLVLAPVHMCRSTIAFLASVAIESISSILDRLNVLVDGWNGVAGAVGLTSIQVGRIDTTVGHALADGFKQTAIEAKNAANAAMTAGVQLRASTGVAKFMGDVDHAVSGVKTRVAAPKPLVPRLGVDVGGDGPDDDVGVGAANAFGKASTQVDGLRKKLAELRGQTDLQRLTADLAPFPAKLAEAKLLLRDIGAAEGMKRVSEAMDAVQRDIDAISKTPIELKLSAFAKLQVPTDQLDAYKRKLQELDAVEGTRRFRDELKKVDDELKRMGMTPIEVQLQAMIDLGRPRAEIEAMQKKLEQLDAGKLGEQLRSELRTPLDDLQDHTASIERAAKAGTISQDEADQLLAADADKLKEMAGLTEKDLTPTRPGGAGIEVGSAAAAEMLDRQFNLPDKPSGLSEKQLAEQKKARELLAKIENSLSKNKDPVYVRL